MKVFVLICLLCAGLSGHSHKVVKAGIQNNPPQSYVEDGIPKGFVVDLMKDFALKNKYKIVFIKDSFNGLYKKLAAGEIDVVLPMAATESRSKLIHFTDESVMLSWMNIVVAARSDVLMLSDLKEKVIGYTRGAYYLDRLQKILTRLKLNCSFREYDDYSTVLKDIENGSLDAAFVGKHSFMHILETASDSSKVRIVDSLFARSLFIAVTRGKTLLLNELNKYLKDGKKTEGSSFNIIHNYWYGNQFSVDDFLKRNLIWLGIAAGILLITVVFNLLLRKKVRAVTREINRQKLFFQNLLRNTPLGVVIFDERFRVIEVNDALIDLLGYSWEELEGRNVKELVGGRENQKGTRRILKKLVQIGSSFKEVKLNTRKGETLDIQLCLSTVTIEGKAAGGVAIYVDITRLKDMELKLARNRSLESIGILAGGIAHDFNNMLSGVIGNLSLARKINDPKKIAGLIEKAERAAVKTTGLAKQLLTFSKGGVLVKEIASAKNIVHDTFALVLSGSSVIYSVEATEDIYSIEGDVTQISQVLSNIVINAKEAMTGKEGRITARLSNYNVEEDSSSLKKGLYVKMIIEDNGKGMAPHVMENIFIPYYSTKEKGSGLGMAISYSIIKKHGGHIEVVSVPGKGTAFTLILPASHKQPSVNTKPDKRLPDNVNILLMDDEKGVREVFSNIMGYHGCRVDLAVNSEEAVELYRKALEKDMKYDMVFLDLTIPGGKGGVDTLEKLRELDKDIKAVATSGYSSCDVFSNYKEYHFTDILAKPFGYEEIIEILTRHSGGTNIN